MADIILEILVINMFEGLFLFGAYFAIKEEWKRMHKPEKDRTQEKEANPKT